jgi:hypothetical protein
MRDHCDLAGNAELASRTGYGSAELRAITFDNGDIETEESELFRE